MMIRLMFRFIFAISKILLSIICFYSIKMMDSFYRCKISADYFFHNKSMFGDITILVCEWMIRFRNKNISLRTQCPSAFPIHMILARKLRIFLVFIPRFAAGTSFYKRFNPFFFYFVSFFEFSIGTYMTPLKRFANISTMFWCPKINTARHSKYYNKFDFIPQWG